jgi:peptidoglycan/LPS O-acetylase OafA/YrhL
MKYKSELDGLRAICISFTIMNHVLATPSWIIGTLGVQVFFILSGYLIAQNLQGKIGWSAVRAFWIRRIFRILPVYWTGFVLSALGALVMDRFLGDSRSWVEFKHSFISVILLCREYGPASAGTFFGHAWSIGVEEKFYILFPVFLFCGRKLIPIAPNSLMAIAVVLTFILPQTPSFSYLSILAGVLLSGYNLKNLEKYSIYLFLLSIALYFAYLHTFSFKNAQLFLICFFAFLCVAVSSDSFVSKVLKNRILVSVGKRSYGIYIYHIVVLNVIETFLTRLTSWILLATATFIGSYIISHYSYKFIEKPMIAKGRKISGKILNSL